MHGAVCGIGTIVVLNAYFFTFTVQCANVKPAQLHPLNPAASSITPVKSCIFRGKSFSKRLNGQQIQIWKIRNSRKLIYVPRVLACAYVSMYVYSTHIRTCMLYVCVMVQARIAALLMWVRWNKPTYVVSQY